ncbi:alkaline phosphatase family protein [Tundrisphaera lichenicola]|uniref:alkaline phosphatase family protein n=1 Tax=Tundrisphaera lichenicola TaxID=2029860 RepID=UPI003EBEE514
MIGLDGLEPSIVGPMLDSGDLPHLSRLRALGGFSRVATTSPAQTPVAWSTFATGTNPGGHGIFDFLRRDPRTYRPDIGLSRFEPSGAFRPPRAVNLRGGTAVWDLLTARGLDSTIIRCPVTYPPATIRGEMLSGMGVPDLRGGFGTATVYASSDSVRASEGERLVKISVGAGNLVATEVIGPPNPKDRIDLRFPIEVEVDPIARSAKIRSEGSPSSLEVREGNWSDWLRVGFKVGAFRTIRGIVRFYLAEAGSEIILYASPVNFDPIAPPFPISHPAEFSREIAEEIGLFHTTGMVEDHGGLNNGRLDEAAYLDQCDLAWREREAMLLRSLDRFDRGLLYCLFDTPDRVQHMFWRYRDPSHPLHVDSSMSRVIEDQYRRSDVMVGHALEAADDRTLVIALSDHGFGPFRRGVHLNTWLLEKGLLALKPGLHPGEEAGDLLQGIDWGRSKAYSLGLGGIYLNLRGREAEGVVSQDEAETLKAEIIRGLDGLKDPRDGEVAIRSVMTRESVYSGPYVGEAPDLLVNFAAGYRASSSTSMGGVGETSFEDNAKKWSGDHIIDPILVPGVLFMNRTFRGENARLEDLAPTILETLGVPKGPNMEGSSLIP